MLVDTIYTYASSSKFAYGKSIISRYIVSQWNHGFFTWWRVYWLDVYIWIYIYTYVCIYPYTMHNIYIYTFILRWLTLVSNWVITLVVSGLRTRIPGLFGLWSFRSLHWEAAPQPQTLQPFIFLGSTTILVVLSLLCRGKHPFLCFFWDTGRLDPSPCKKNTAVTLGDGPVVEQHFSPMIVMARNWGYSTPIPYLLLIPFGFLVIYNLSILPFWFLLTSFSFSFGWLQHVP